jgi:membrane protease YdiL (CAAX protease family)
MAVAESPLRTLLIYTTVTYAVSWPSWALWGVLSESPPLVRTVLFVLGGLGPFIAGAVLTHRSKRRVREWLADVFHLRVPARYYVAALALPVGVILVAGTVHLVVFDGTLTLEALPETVEYPLFLGVVVLFGGGLEEPGWRGYLLPRLQERYSALAAALAIGVVWAGWHLPLFVLPGTVQSEMVPLLYVTQMVSMSVVLTWITNAVGGSVVPAVLLHAGGNAILNYYPTGGASGAVSPLGLGLLVATLTAFAIGLVIVYGPETLAPGDDRR